MTIEAGLRVGHREDDRNVHLDLDSVDAAQDHGVGVAEAHRRHRHQVGVDAGPEEAVLALEHPLEGGRGKERPEVERDHGGAVLLLPEGRREDHRHQHVDQLLVPGHYGKVLDRLPQLGRLPQLLFDHPRQHSLDRVRPRHLLRPEVDERSQAQLDLERKLRRGGCDERLQVRGWDNRNAHDETSPFMLGPDARDTTPPIVRRQPAPRLSSAERCPVPGPLTARRCRG